MPFRVSLPRRDGQGHRNGIGLTLTLVALLAVTTACGVIAPGPPEPAAPSAPGDGEGSSRRAATHAATPPEPFVAASFGTPAVEEASGVAASVRNPGWVYVLDDGPGTRGVAAVDTASNARVDVVVDGLDGRDTEGLAVAECAAADPAGRSCLYIGDIGNNEALWPTVDVWRVPEPVLRPRRAPLHASATVSSYGYERAPANAEALLVADGRPFVVTKERRRPSTGRTPRPHLLAADRWDSGVLRDLGPIPLPAPSVGLAAAVVGNVVTGGDVRADGIVVLRTYDHVVAYTPPTPGAQLDTLSTWSARELAGTPGLPLPEGLAADGCGLWLVSEGVDSLWLVPWAATGVRAATNDIEERRCPSGSEGS